MNKVKHFEVFTLYANTNLVDTRIVCPICTVIMSCERLGIVALWLTCQSLEQADQGRFSGGHLLQIVFFSFRFSPCNSKLLHTSNMELI